MATSEEPLWIEDNSYLYRREDVKIIISLLEEFSNKLMKFSLEIEELKLIRRRLMLLISALAAASFFFCVVWILNYNYIERVTVMISLIFVSFILTIMTANLNDIFRKIRFLERSSKRILIRLEKLIRIVSQVEDHAFQSYGERIELDLRLTHAELVIERYKYAVDLNYFKFF